MHFVTGLVEHGMDYRIRKLSGDNLIHMLSIPNLEALFEKDENVHMR